MPKSSHLSPTIYNQIQRDTYTDMKGSLSNAYAKSINFFSNRRDGKELFVLLTFVRNKTSFVVDSVSGRDLPFTYA